MVKGSFVAYKVEDNAERYPYKYIHLDDLASLFAIQGDCAAVAKFQDKIILSYNASEII